MTREAVVIVASTRTAAGAFDDRTGPLLSRWLLGRGWGCAVAVVADGDPVGAAIDEAIVGGAALVVTTGGTGLSPTDRTPEQTRARLDYEIPGIAEELRRRGAAATPFAVLSRGLAGVAGTALLVNLPGSPGAVADGIAVLDGLLDHVVDQLAGGDHVRERAGR